MTRDRYSRQILFRGIGVEGQERIKRGRVCVVGCGALGTVSAEMLVRAGAGRIQLVDRDFVEESNLQRQSLFTEADATERIPKAMAAERALRSVNGSIEVRGVVADLTAANADEVLSGFDLLVDGTDNFETRLLINDFCVKNGLPWVYGGCVGSYGLTFAILPGKTPCLQCFFQGLPGAGLAETCETVGVIAPVVHVVAARQVAQVLRILVGLEPGGRLLQVDVWEDQWRPVSIRAAADPECRCCGRKDFRYLEGGGSNRFLRLCGRDAVQVTPGEPVRVDFDTLSERLSRLGRVRTNAYVLRAELDGYDITLFQDGRAIIRGTDDLAVAKSVYTRYIGR